MLYLIGLGLNESGFSYEAFNTIKNSRIVYLENYTINLPYEKEEIEELIQKKVKLADREFVENFKILKEAKEKNVALLVYGSPLIATTHVSLIQEAKKQKIPIRIIQASSILDAITETGLQIYKFGKIASMPEWKKNFTPESFMEILQQNLSINAHTLILIDIGLEFSKALEQLEISAKNKKIKLNKIVICQSLGTKHKKIFYNNIKELKKIKIKKPFCIIIPSKLHFMEKEFLNQP